MKLDRRHSRRTCAPPIVRTPLRVELLEARSLPSGSGWAGLLNPLVETETNDTLDVAHDLGFLSAAAQTQAIGIIGNSAAGAADVDWYSFTLSQAATVNLTLYNQQGGAVAATVGLYNNATDVFDPYVPTGHRLLGQNEAQVGNACVEQLLAPGTYFVAVSGAGNRYFYPFLADSGTAGQTGDYALVLRTTDFQPSAGSPEVIHATPAPGAVLNQSPFEIRLTFSDMVDFSPIAPGVNVTLTYNSTGTFGDGNDRDVTLLATFSASANELQLLPVSPLTYAPQPLGPGHYRLFLAQNSSAIPLAGDFTTTFEINGSEGRTGGAADDTPATATDLGNVTGAGLIQVAGALGDDPAYDPAQSDPLLANPAADVDLYHFEITGSGNHAVVVQVAAGAIGSLFLDPAVSLFQNVGGQLQLVAVNDNSENASLATDGNVPLYADSVLFVGLQAGDYYLAVSGTSNRPDPAQGIDPGTNGVFDPTVSHSGLNGFTTGDYVLNLLVQPDNAAPHVTAVSLAEGAVLTTAPTQFTVEFNEAVNLQPLAFNQLQLTGQGDLAAVFIRDAAGVDYYPRLLSYDSTTNRATFLMLDRVPNGANELHLSGALGLTDLAGNPLTGSNPADPASDFIVSFTVAAPLAGSPGNPQLWLNQEPNDSLGQAQVLGTLFPHELQTGVVIRRDFTATPGSAPADGADFYQFAVLQQRSYFFALSNTAGLPVGTRPQIFNAAGNAVFTTGGAVRLANLSPGIYTVRVGGWMAATAAAAKYDLRMTLGASPENPIPLSSGPRPAYRINIVTTSGSGSTPGSTPPNAVVLPPLAAPSGNVVPAVLSSATGNSILLGLLPNSFSQFSTPPVGGLRSATGSSPVQTNRVGLSPTRSGQPGLFNNVALGSGSTDVVPATAGDSSDLLGPVLDKVRERILDFFFWKGFEPTPEPTNFSWLAPDDFPEQGTANEAGSGDATAEGSATVPDVGPSPASVDVVLGAGLLLATGLVLTHNRQGITPPRGWPKPDHLRR